MRLRFVASLALACAAFTQAHATELEDRLRSLEERSAAQQREIEELKQQAAPPKPEAPQAPPATSLFGGAALTNPYISLILNTYAFGSSVDRSKLEDLGIPGYTHYGIEGTKGFNLDSAELSVFAPVDPYFNVYAVLPVTEDGASVEEAYFVTTGLPEGFQVKGGLFKSGFGRLNAQHAHAWDFVDAPLVYRAFLGDEGYADKGVQLTWLPSLPVYLQLGAEVLQGDNDRLLGADAKQAPHALTAFAKVSLDVGDASTVLFGPSVLVGSADNDSLIEGRTFRGTSRLYGMEFTYKWKPSKERSATLQAEYMYLDQDGRLKTADDTREDALSRRQDGAYVQGTYQWERWRVAARYDRLGILCDTVDLTGSGAGGGSPAWRATGAVEFNPSEFSRIRLQASRDLSARDGTANNEIFLQLIFGIGAHAAHQF